MTLARCRACRGVLSADEPICPHCGATKPVDLSRDENWMTGPDRMRDEPDHENPFRMFALAATLLMLVAVLLAWCAVAT
jgi:hypothetical protein